MQAQMTLAELGRTYTQWSAEEARFNAMLEMNTKMARAERKGERRGRKEGIVYGIAQGAHEKAIETARGMLADCMPLPTISKYTGLSIEELQHLVTEK